MATRTPTPSYAPNGNSKLVNVSWAGLLQSSSDVGEAVEVPGADRSVQLTGTLGTGGVVTIEGSNMAAPVAATAAHWGALSDPQGNTLTLDTIGQIKQVAEVVRWIRPRVSAGDGSTNLGVELVAGRP